MSSNLERLDHFLNDALSSAGMVIGIIGMGTGIYLTISSMKAQLWSDVLTYAALTGAVYYFYAHTWNHHLPTFFEYQETVDEETEEPTTYTRSSYSCGICGEKGHNARKCPNRMSAEWEWY